jgi:phage terminase large subunit
MQVKAIRFEGNNFTSVYDKIRDFKKRFVVNYGGTGSSKSYSQAQNEIIKLLTENVGDTIIFRKTGASHKESTWKEINEKIDIWNLRSQFKIETVQSPIKEIRFLDVGRKISFFGIDDTEKIKSIKGYQRAWIEEANELLLADFYEINRRLRGFENIQITLTLNPISKLHWIPKTFYGDNIFSQNADIIQSTYKDNEFLTEQDRLFIESMKDIDVNQYNIYGKGEWGEQMTNRPFAFNFKMSKHVTAGLKIVDTLPVWISFDFNVDPITAIVAQFDNNLIRIIKEYRLSNSDIHELCKRISADFMGKNYYLKITGDASGKNRSAMVSGNVNYYILIKQILKLNDSNFFVQSSNSSIKNSRALTNYILGTQDILINDTCQHLIDDLLYVEMNEQGDIDKTKDKHRTHLLDCFRYFIDVNFQKYLSKSQF